MSDQRKVCPLCGGGYGIHHEGCPSSSPSSLAAMPGSPSREAVAAKIRVDRPYREAGKWWRNVTIRMTETDANKIAADAELMTVKW